MYVRACRGVFPCVHVFVDTHMHKNNLECHPQEWLISHWHGAHQSGSASCLESQGSSSCLHSPSARITSPCQHAMHFYRHTGVLIQVLVFLVFKKETLHRPQEDFFVVVWILFFVVVALFDWLSFFLFKNESKENEVSLER